MSFIQRAVEELGETLQSKNSDYRIGDEFSNFRFAADLVGEQKGEYVKTDEVMLTQIGIKLGRLAGLPEDPKNESRLDTLKDLAGYAIILYAYSLSVAEGPVDPFRE